MVEVAKSPYESFIQIWFFVLINTKWKHYDIA